MVELHETLWAVLTLLPFIVFCFPAPPICTTTFYYHWVATYGCTVVLTAASWNLYLLHEAQWTDHGTRMGTATTVALAVTFGVWVMFCLPCGPPLMPRPRESKNKKSYNLPGWLPLLVLSLAYQLWGARQYDANPGLRGAVYLIALLVVMIPTTHAWKTDTFNQNGWQMFFFSVFELHLCVHLTETLVYQWRLADGADRPEERFNEWPNWAYGALPGLIGLRLAILFLAPLSCKCCPGCVRPLLPLPAATAAATLASTKPPAAKTSRSKTTISSPPPVATSRTAGRSTLRAPPAPPPLQRVPACDEESAHLLDGNEWN